jgi:hypothetical protein
VFGFDSYQRREIFVLTVTSRPTLGPTHSPVQWVPETPTGIKRKGREFVSSPPSSADVKNGGAIPLLQHKTRCMVLN